MKSTNALDWACDLEKSGMPNEQAVAVAQVFHESHETLMENMREMIATSHDNVIKAVGKLEGEIRRVEDKLGGDIQRVEDKLGGEIQSRHRWLTGLMIGLTGLILAVLRIFPQMS